MHNIWEYSKNNFVILTSNHFFWVLVKSCNGTRQEEGQDTYLSFFFMKTLVVGTH